MQGNLLLLCGNVLMIFCSGTVVPSAYLPRVVGSIGKWLPLNLFHEYSAQMLFGSIEVKLVLWMIIWGLAAGGIGVLIAWKRHGTYYN